MALARLLVFSNLWIALGASAFTFMTYWVFDKPVNYYFPLLNGCATLFLYNYQVIVKLQSFKTPSTEKMLWLKKNQMFVAILMIVGLMGAVWTALYLPYKTLIYLVISGLVAVSYTRIPGAKTGLRFIPGIKVLLIAAVWTFVTAFLPLFNEHQLNLTSWLYMASVFVFLLAITIPFDIRDVRYDPEKLKTIPQVVGVKTSRAISVVLVLGTMILWYLTASFSIPLLIIYTVFLITLILKSTPDQPDMYYTGLLDGTLVLIPLLYYFFY